MASNRKEKLNKELRKLIATFVERESNKTSLVTVTRCEITSDLRTVTAYISVLPEDKEQDAVTFLIRRKKDAWEYLKKNLRIRTIPYIDFVIDEGEKNRQEIDRLLKNG